ncbi:DUF2778 domain-containing protein [Herbaspirillum sp. RTI4]|uniref:DUF2778 domain-containing protein n=1 Tax=Herbaspirillum sp. RTI4 TaxID=3048640 RepID=UPI002AB5A755|nr:DUF2778 domain-containing protein [Herbaspirillum sp. RTI4]MDY7579687.1 DUF2778 domain-containing protein [Herbaspirillum sp. RTI4]
MIECSFELNNKPMSVFKCGGKSFPAFSGLQAYANRRAFACVTDVGPIPPGAYYIIDRQSGGILGPLRDMVSGQKDWFSLYGIDNNIDDEVYCNQVARGNFRLHPKGVYGISKGCITIEAIDDFQVIKNILKKSMQIEIPGKHILAYGKVSVR